MENVMDKGKAKGLELHSEPVQEIMGTPPGRLVRYGITVILAAVVLLLAGSHFVKFPDILEATVTINARNLPVQVKTRNTGRIDTLFVKDGDEVAQGKPLALVENPADYKDVAFLAEHLRRVRCDTARITGRDLHLGPLQDSYSAFVQASDQLRFFTENDYAGTLIESRKEQITVLDRTLHNQEARLRISAGQLGIVHDRFAADSALYAGKFVAKITYQESEKAYLQQQMSHRSLISETDNIRLSLLQSRQAVTELQQGRAGQINTLTLQLDAAREQLEARIRQWEQDYLLVSPIRGRVAITRYWQKNQHVTAGETVMTIVPTEKSEHVGTIILPQRGVGKVRPGQTVNVKLDDYPYLEFGFVQVPLAGISFVPFDGQGNEKLYMLEVNLPDTLRTQYGKEIPYRPEMTGIAEIITDDLSILDRIFNPIKAVLKR